MKNDRYLLAFYLSCIADAIVRGAPSGGYKAAAGFGYVVCRSTWRDRRGRDFLAMEIAMERDESPTEERWLGLKIEHYDACNLGAALQRPTTSRWPFRVAENTLAPVGKLPGGDRYTEALCSVFLGPGGTRLSLSGVERFTNNTYRYRVDDELVAVRRVVKI